MKTVKAEPDMAGCYVTDPQHGGKVTCRVCGEFIDMGYEHTFHEQEHDQTLFWCADHFNRYEHYYGLDRRID